MSILQKNVLRNVYEGGNNIFVSKYAGKIAGKVAKPFFKKKSALFRIFGDMRTEILKVKKNA